MAVFVTGDLHGGLDIQKLRDWEAGEKHVVLYDNIVTLGAGSDSWSGFSPIGGLPPTFSPVGTPPFGGGEMAKR